MFSDVLLNHLHESIFFFLPKAGSSNIVVVSLLSHVQLLKTPWTVAYQAPLTMEFPRQEYWNGMSFPTRGDLSVIAVANTGKA